MAAVQSQFDGVLSVGGRLEAVAGLLASAAAEVGLFIAGDVGAVTAKDLPSTGDSRVFFSAFSSYSCCFSLPTCPSSPAVEYLEQGHGVGEVPHWVLVIGEPTKAAVVTQETQQIEPLDLIRQLHNCLLDVALESHYIDDNDDGESEIQDETDGVVVEEPLNGDILPSAM